MRKEMKRKSDNSKEKRQKGRCQIKEEGDKDRDIQSQKKETKKIEKKKIESKRKATKRKTVNFREKRQIERRAM